MSFPLLCCTQTANKHKKPEHIAGKTSTVFCTPTLDGPFLFKTLFSHSRKNNVLFYGALPVHMDVDDNDNDDC
jgi:hypothetical protein